MFKMESSVAIGPGIAAGLVIAIEADINSSCRLVIGIKYLTSQFEVGQPEFGWVQFLTAGIGGMGGAQPLAITMNGGVA